LDLLSTSAKLPRKVSEYIQTHVSVTPSGLFSQRYLHWALEVLGPDRILFSTDYPFVQIPQGGAGTFLEQAELSESDTLKIASGNWDRLSADIRR